MVLSRLIDITADANIDSGALLERLVAQNPASYNFHVPIEDGGVLIGASPELLLRKDGDHFSSLPLAARRGVSRMTYWTEKPGSACWPPRKTAMNTIS